jgi:hypothetical protein
MEPNIWMMTVGIDLNCSVSLHNLAKYLDVDGDIIGIKYKYLDKVILKGTYNTSKKNGNQSLFSNQVSIAIIHKNRNINVKVFKNGTLHITGVNSESQILMVKDLLINAFNKLAHKKDTCILVSTEFPLVNSDNILFNSTGTRDIGYYDKENDRYIIDRRTFRYSKTHEIYIHVNNLYEKDILDLDGVLIGKQKLVNNTKYKRIYKNGKKLVETYHGVYLDDVLMGTYEYTFSAPRSTFERVTNCIVNYPMYPFDSGALLNAKDYMEKDINYYNIYVNYTYPSKFDSTQLSRYLESCGYLINYDGKKSKVNLTFKNNPKCIGKCNCEYSCICNNVTIFIFQTGKINVYGIKKLSSIGEIMTVLNGELDTFVEQS